MLSRVGTEGAPTHQLVIEEVFNRLTAREQLYAHHLSQAAWNGARIILRQTSPEANDIFDFIIALHKSCNGRWIDWVTKGAVTEQELSAFLEYAALFLSNIGNYFADGGKKIIPNISADAIGRLARHSNETKSLLDKVIEPMLSTTPSSFGYPSDNSQANYYPGEHRITRHEVGVISKVLEAHNIEPENTRVMKGYEGNKRIFDILQASADTEFIAQWDELDGDDVVVRILSGDHHKEMSKICESLVRAKEFASNETQVNIIDHYVESFRTGSLQAFRESQKEWVKDKSPVVEAMLGFVEPYRDPHGVRGEWEGIVCISDPIESLRLNQLVEKSDTFIRLMPWALPGSNNGKGPFEKELFEAPDFISVHALTSCSSIVWSGINLPNYNDIRETCGSKNLVVANRLRAENDMASPCYYVHPSEVKRYKECVHSISNITTAVHELLGHGSGKLLSEKTPNEYNFDKEHPPISPLTGERVNTWYLPGQTWTSVFGEISGEVEECRAEVMSMYLMDNTEILSIFGHDDTTSITPDDILYNTYLHIGVQGLQALAFYNAEEQAWGEPHRSGQFAILKHLLVDGGGVLTVDYDATASILTVAIDRTKLHSCGQPALGRLLCSLQIWRCTADVEPCTAFYKGLSAVDGEYEEWRKSVCAKPEPRWKFVQANTFLGPDGVELKVYDESNEGIIHSWAEREI
ncbi:hypothetical protein N7499_004579 [Penicillium canescens]|nr:hypothetical protein N7499_004579 [Penicillium canescens]KAJ6161736.1 hypothetical protein N7485_009966 [Penicillium canescens]